MSRGRGRGPRGDTGDAPADPDSGVDALRAESETLQRKLHDLAERLSSLKE
jgi:hypothetical protein